MDTKLELLKNRDSLEYTFKTLSDMKDGKYKGHWKNSKPSGMYVNYLAFQTIDIVFK